MSGPSRAEPLAAAAQAVGAGDERVWLVGGAVRDRLLGRETVDFDVVVDGDPGQFARAVGRDAGGHAFRLSEAFGAWRVTARDRRWQLDVIGLVDGSIEEDLRRRDLTINAIAEPLGGDGALVDPLGGVADLRARRLRMVSVDSFSADPLRVMRLARLAVQLGFEAEPATLSRARASAPGLADIAAERIFAELCAVLGADAALDGLMLLGEVGATAVVLPELGALRGVGQSRYHHLDVADHTRAVLAETVSLVAEPERLGLAPGVTRDLAAAFAQPLTAELTRGGALRFGALLHDIAKPRTRAVGDDGRVTFVGHSALGAEMTDEILGRLRASQRLRAHVAALTRHHLRLGFLVHRCPLSRRDVYGYLHDCAPVGVDVTVLSIADRLSTRGAKAEVAIERHLELARAMIGEALAYEADPPRSPLRGDELGRGLGLAPGPRIGALLADLEAAAFAGEIDGPDAALALARRILEEEG